MNAFHLKQLGDVEETVAHEETEVAADLGEEGQLGVADKFCCHLSFCEIEGCFFFKFQVLLLPHGGSRVIYSLVHLIVPKLEELISRTLLGLFKIRLLFQDRVRSHNFRF